MILKINILVSISNLGIGQSPSANSSLSKSFTESNNPKNLRRAMPVADVRYSLIQFPTSVERSEKRHFVGIFEIGTHRDTVGKAGDLNAEGF